MGGYSFDLSGRTALVTGASSGVGQCLAKALAKSGARVALAARRVDRLETLASEIAADGGESVCIQMDVSDEGSIISGFDAAESKFGMVDTIVANAGLARPGGALILPAAEFDDTLATNLRGVFLTAREGARRILANTAGERGRIVLISSITAQEVTADMAAYSASKAAVTQMGRVLAKEWAPQGLNVNVLAPGYMVTEMTEAMWAHEAGKQLLDSFPRKRIMTVEALIPLLLYLSSDASREVTGSIFTIEDGQTL